MKKIFPLFIIIISGCSINYIDPDLFPFGRNMNSDQYSLLVKSWNLAKQIVLSEPQCSVAIKFDKKRMIFSIDYAIYFYDKDCIEEGLLGYNIENTGIVALCQSFFNLDNDVLRAVIIIHENAHILGIKHDKNNEASKRFSLEIINNCVMPYLKRNTYPIPEREIFNNSVSIR
jgi:hypothetical protein